MPETQVQSLCRDTPEKGMAIHSSIVAWKIPWTDEPGGLQSMGSQRVGHDCVTNTTGQAMLKILLLLKGTEYLQHKGSVRDGGYIWPPMFLVHLSPEPVVFLLLNVEDHRHWFLLNSCSNQYYSLLLRCSRSTQSPHRPLKHSFSSAFFLSFLPLPYSLLSHSPSCSNSLFLIYFSFQFVF